MPRQSYRSIGSAGGGGTPAASMPSAIFNLVNAILGGGIVALPNAWAQSGFIWGWIMFVAVALLSTYTLELLVGIADPLCRLGKIATVSYELLVEAVLGKKGRILVLATQFLYAFGIAVGYIVIIKTNLPDVLGSWGALSMDDAGDVSKMDRILVVLGISVVLLLPVSSLRSMSALGFVSFICFFCGFMMIGVVSYEIAKDKDDLCTADNPCTQSYDSFAKMSFFSVFGVFVFTKACHHNEFQIYRSLGERANPERWTIVTRTSILLVSLITSCCAMITYALFGDRVQDDFFLSFGNAKDIEDMPVVLVGKLLFVAVLAMSFPMQLFVCRETVQVLVADWRESQSQTPHALLEDPERVKTRLSSALDQRPEDDRKSAAGGAVRENTSNCMHYGTTVILFAVVLGLGLLADSLKTVLALVGGVAGSLIAFVLPGVVGWLSEDRLGIAPIGGRFGRFYAGATAIFGTITMIITTLVTIAPGIFPVETVPAVVNATATH